MNLRHGHYFLDSEKGFFIFNTWAKKGRAILDNGKSIEVTYKSHPKIVKAILTKGERVISPGIRNFRKGERNQKK